jgi:hypothetical protein
MRKETQNQLVFVFSVALICLALLNAYAWTVLR